MSLEIKNGKPHVPAWIRVLMALDRKTTALAMTIAVAMLILSVACGLYQVIARFLFEAPSDWSEVLTRFALIWMVYLGASVALRNGAMVSVDLMHRKLPVIWRKRLDWFIACSAIFLFGLMIYWGFFISWRIRYQNVPGLEISIAWAYLAIPVGSVFSMISIFANLADPKRNELETAI